jgi:hypothetical protein
VCASKFAAQQASASTDAGANSGVAGEAVRLAQALLQQQYSCIGHVYIELQQSLTRRASISGGHTQQQQQHSAIATVPDAVSSAEVDSALQQSLQLVHAGKTDNTQHTVTLYFHCMLCIH